MNLLFHVIIIELVQIDDDTKEAIGALVEFTLKTQSIKEFNRFQKAVEELRYFFCDILP